MCEIIFTKMSHIKGTSMKKRCAGLLLAFFASFFVVSPANAVTQICWSWSMQGVITGTFTTNAPSGGMTGATIASGSYTASDVAVLTSNIPSSATQAPVGSISDGTYYFSQNDMGFVWDGSRVTQFNRFNGTYTNGSVVFQTGSSNRLLFDINVSFFLPTSPYLSFDTATLTPLNDGVCASGGGGGGPSGNAEASPWVGAQSVICPAPNPWVKEQLGFASNAKPVLVTAENTIGKTITQGSYDALKSSGVVFDTGSKKVSTATETLPIYGCKDKLLSGKVNQPIQFIAGGYTLQSNAHGYINTADLKWHDTNGVTLYTNTAAFMHTVKFTKEGKYVVVLTEQPDTSRGLIPTYGVRSVRFVMIIN